MTVIITDYLIYILNQKQEEAYRMKGKQHKPISSFFCSDSLGLAYLRIHKSGCTTVEYWMARNHPAYQREQSFAIHSRGANKTYFDKVTAKEQACEDYLRFTFVRHPLRRLESCYRDKIAPGTTRIPHIFKNLEKYGIEHGMPYREVVHNLLKVKNPAELNPHIAPQWYFLFRNNRLRVDLICRLEQFQLYMDKLRQMTHSSIDPNIRNSTSKKSEPLTLTDREKRSLACFFRPECEFLGYRIE
ncbi:MAG: sulfotransferase family 2 domain-containing protein [Deltaproteobacteria bacterium]|nr:sulfotransferase family 2 domain-containing protein [Deltaproteobacteria bacterium]